MSYYMGDYYRGDYYRGDGVFGGIVGAIGGGFKGLVTGGLSGAFKGAVEGGYRGLVGGQTAKTPTSTPPIRPLQLPTPPTLPSTPLMITPPQQPTQLVPYVKDVPATTPGAVKTPGLAGLVERILPGGKSGYQPGSVQGYGAPSGYHWNKAFSYAKGLPAGSFLTRNRQMNPVNPRALRRAIRRQQGMVALMRRTLKGSGFKITRSGLGGRKSTKRRR